MLGYDMLLKRGRLDIYLRMMYGKSADSWLPSCSGERSILGPGWVGCGMGRLLIFSRWIMDIFNV